MHLHFWYLFGILQAIMIERTISIPDWHGDHIALPEEGVTPPVFSYTFFPDAREAGVLAQATPEGIAQIIRKQPDLTSRFFHELIAKGRTDEAQATIGLLGGAEAAADFVNHDCHSALCSMTFDFVPEDEIKRFITGLHDLGLNDLEDSRWNLHRADKARLKQVKKSVPQSDALAAYVEKYNSGQLNIYGSVQYTKDFRVVDPRRGLGYVGLGNTKDYDWIDISGVGGFEETAHYTAPDKDTMIALLSVY